MGEATAISWAEATYNPWWGCTRVSPACDHCYAEAFAHRLGLDLWDASGDRKFFPDAHWDAPLRWNRKAEARGEPMRVFCASMADVFEDHPALAGERDRLWELIEATPWLRWMLLTKRPQNMRRMAPHRWSAGWPANVWAGTTAENDRYAALRLRHLAPVPAAVRFISAEPLLGPFALAQPVEWVIIGGESGRGARRMDPQWAAELIDSAASVGAAVHFKQPGTVLGREWGCTGKMHDPAEWPEAFRVQQFPRS